MPRLLWEFILFAACLGASWWFLVRPPTTTHQPTPIVTVDSRVVVLPAIAEPVPLPEPVEVEAEDKVEAEPEHEHEPEPEHEHEPSTAQQQPTPPPPERGSPEGEEPAGQGEPLPLEVSAAMQDPALQERAREELTGKASQGFTTVLRSAPEDQADIARFFGESLVLVPRAALDPQASNPQYFTLDPAGAVRTVAGRPPLEEHRQYRDFFDYEYARLPESLRTLRRSVLARGEIYLFAALIPGPEWALVIARRDAALASVAATNRPVRRFDLRYLRQPGGGFDLEVVEILLVDGTLLRPASGNHHP